MLDLINKLLFIVKLLELNFNIKLTLIFNRYTIKPIKVNTAPTNLKLLNIIKCIRSLIPMIRDTHCINSDFIESLQDLIKKFQELYDDIRLCKTHQENSQISKKLELIQEIIIELRKSKNQEIAMQAFPLINVLSKLDQEWFNKDPIEFKELKKHIIKLHNEPYFSL